MKNSQRGFTIIELLIATAVFSVILLLGTYALLQIGRVYIKGVTMTRAQEVSRNALAEISQSIQFSGGTILLGSTGSVNSNPAVPGSDNGVFCIGSTRFTYTTNRQLTDSATPGQYQAKQVLIKDTIAGCNPAIPVSLQPSFNSDAKELTGLNMRLRSLSVKQVPGTTNSYTISIVVVYGDDDILNPNWDNCGVSVNAGGGWCAASQLTTTVRQRLK
jgi:prepilin-type N-terminal cleavage/methylation domain-containing protein